MKDTISKTSSVGKFMMLVGILGAIPVIESFFNIQDFPYVQYFLLPAAFSLLIGFLLYLYGRRKRDVAYTLGWKPSMQQSSLVVLFAWLWGILIGALPFFLSGQLSFLYALFEAISGWTTTGLSVMDTSRTPKILLFHRSFMQFCGGLGFVMMMNMFIQEKQSMRLYHAEGHVDKLLPNLRKTTQLIFMMYGGLLIIGTILYQIVGMGFFEALVHAMCALSTGGFSTHMNSIGEYHSIGIELVTSLLMMFGKTNFAVLFLIFKLKWRKVFNIS
ncbi:MAG: potassium transporter TrkG [Sphaerochaetaceae bacterium]